MSASKNRGMNEKGLGRDEKSGFLEGFPLLARHSPLVPNPPRPNFSMRDPAQTSREKWTASSLQRLQRCKP